MYPDAETGVGFTQKGTGDTNAEWVMKEDIRIAEYWYTERKPDKLCLLSDGTSKFRSDLPITLPQHSSGTSSERRSPPRKPRLGLAGVTL